MANSMFILALVALSACAANAEVLVLTKDNWKETMEKHPAVLVEFYAPWCGHCKKLEPEWEKASETSSVPLGKVDATIESELAKEHDVSGYPTIKFFQNGKASEYDGGRDAQGILDWVKLMTGPAVEELEDASKAPEARPGKATVLLTAPELTEAFKELAIANRKAANWVYAKGDAEKVTISHAGQDAIETTVDKVDIEDIKFSLFMRLDGDTYGSLMERKKPLLWTLVQMEGDKIEESIAELRPVMTNIAKKHKGDISVTYTDTAQFKQAIEGMLGITEYPRLCYQDLESKKKFIYDGEMEEAKMSQWIDDVKAGKIESKLKSEAEPEKNDEPVKIVTGNTLEAMVFNAEKDVLFEVYAPWCGHCKTLAPHFEKLGQKVQREKLEDIVTIAKMDGTLNESPNAKIEWSGFPTLFYIKAGTSEPVKYDGPREAKGMWKWIKANHSQKDKVADRVKANKAERAATDGGAAADDVDKEDL